MATHAPAAPTRLSGGSWIGVLRRTVRGYREDNLSDWAAALTYYGVLAIFPALIALVSILGLIGHGATQPLISNLEKLGPSSARTILINGLHGLQRSRGAAGALFFVGLGGAIWSASGYIAAFMRAGNAVYGVEEGRPFWMTIPLRLAVTVLLLALLAISAVAVVVTGGLATQVGKLLGIGSTAVTVWDIAKWPVLVLLVSAMFSILYWTAPNVRHPGLAWITPGGLLAVVIWLIASGVFALYVANFGSYNKTYGALGGVVIFLVWLWISNIAVLLGAECNAALARARAIEAGQPAEREPVLEPRRESR